MARFVALITTARLLARTAAVVGFVGDMSGYVADLAHTAYVTEQDMSFGYQSDRCAAGLVRE